MEHPLLKGEMQLLVSRQQYTGKEKALFKNASCHLLFGIFQRSTPLGLWNLLAIAGACDGSM
jgi:hypothetical protein